MLGHSQMRSLKAKAHALKPVVMISSKGLSENVNTEIDTALTVHELIKIRISNQDKDAVKAMINEITSRHNAILINTIGHVVVVYREKPKKP